MTLDEQITILEHNAEYERTHGNLQGCLEFRQLAEWLVELKQLKEQEDTISRSELLKAIDTYDKFGYIAGGLIPLVSENRIKFVPYIHYDDVVKCIKSMPSITPQKVGKMELEEKNKTLCICPECGAEVAKYRLICSLCGAWLEELEEGE